MKKIIVKVCAIVMCGFVMVSCVDNSKVRNVYSLKLKYEKVIKEYERLDSMTMDDVRHETYDKAEEARTIYLNAFAKLNDAERKEYAKLEEECKKADEDYLGSIYEDEDSTDKEYKKLEYNINTQLKSYK